MITDLKERARLASSVTLLGTVVNVILAIIKLAAGIFGNSQAMLADAIHTLSDFASDIVVFIGIRFAKKPRDFDHAYGHGMYETLSAMVIGLFLLFVGGKIGYGAVMTLNQAFHGITLESPEPIAFWVALISIGAKEFLFHKTYAVGEKIRNDAIIANAWHHRSDAYSSIGTALGIGAAAFLGEKWAVMDPIAAIIVSLLLVQASLRIIREQMGGLTEKSISVEVRREIIALVKTMPALYRPHNLRTRKVGSTIVIELHVRVHPDMRVDDAHDLSNQLERKIKDLCGESTITTIHIEPLKLIHRQRRVARSSFRTRYLPRQRRGIREPRFRRPLAREYRNRQGV